MSAYDREIDHLERQLEGGDISQKEFNHELLELQRDYRAAAEEAAEQAYRAELANW